MLHASVWWARARGSSTANAAAVLLSAAGALHVGAAPQHWGHSPAHGLFLLVVGLGELLWAAVFWRRQSPELRAAGVVLAGGSIVLWAITRVFPAPFGHGPEEIGLIDVASKLPELLVLLILVLAGAGEPSEEPVPAWVEPAGLLALASAAGVLIFWLATAAEPALPWLGGDDADGSPTVAASARDGRADRLEVVVAGIGAPLASGDELPIAGDLEAQLTFAPGAARFNRDLGLRLFRSGGAPVSDATIVAAGHMRFMDHGAFRQAAIPSSDGQYALPLVFVMPGEWQVDLEIVTPTERGTVQLDLDLIE
jgi:YtkA-like protein